MWPHGWAFIALCIGSGIGAIIVSIMEIVDYLRERHETRKKK